MNDAEGKPLFWLHGEVHTPPFSLKARRLFGRTMRRIQRGEKLAKPLSEPMPEIGPRVHELRVNDENIIHRIIYRIDRDAIVIAEVFTKKTQKHHYKLLRTVKSVIEITIQLETWKLVCKE